MFSIKKRKYLMQANHALGTVLVPMLKGHVSGPQLVWLSSLGVLLFSEEKIEGE